MPGPVQLAEFFAFLRTGGEAAVFREEFRMIGENPEVWQAAYQEECESLPGFELTPPAWHPETALAATAFLYQLCQALANRALEEDKVRAICAAHPPAPTSAGEVLSADLSLRYLPELYALATSINREDPLVAGLETIAPLFPFSSAGIPLKSPADLSSIQAHDGLWRLYIDRVIESQDASRLVNPDVRLAVKDALGDYGLSLAPRIATQLALDSQPRIAETSGKSET
jgi:hypothetical protein